MITVSSLCSVIEDKVEQNDQDTITNTMHGHPLTKQILREETRNFLRKSMTNEICHRAGTIQSNKHFQNQSINRSINHTGWAIRNRLAKLDQLVSARSISVFISRTPEVDTGPLIEYLYKLRKQVYLPTWRGSGEMRMVLVPDSEAYHRIINEKKTQTGMIPRPAYPEDSQRVPHDRLDLIIIPSLLFDTRGNRLGHGYGHYDRYLTQYKSTAGDSNDGLCKIGISHDEQLYHGGILPHEPHDWPVDMIITPTRLITTHNTHTID